MEKNGKRIEMLMEWVPGDGWVERRGGGEAGKGRGLTSE